MDLETARGLKEELWAFIDETRVPTRGGQVLKPEVAMGFAPVGRRGDVHIAVRAESEEELPQSLADDLRRRAKKQIDIRYTGKIAPFVGSYVAPAKRLLEVGSSIAHYRCGVGTLGFFARRASDGVTGIVSNNHVIAANDEGNDHDEIIQSAHEQHGTKSRDVVAYLCGKYPRLRGKSASLDCAFAPIAEGMQFDPAPGGSPLKSALSATTTEPTTVAKIGRTTSLTRGRVTAFELDNVRVTYPFGRIAFTGQIEIEPAQGVPFSRPGDSGSLIFTLASRQPLGLIFSGSLRGGASGLGLTFANPIASVLDALGVTLIT